jgi:hypothetical protein
MAKKCGQYAVTVHREDGTNVQYLPGQEYKDGDDKLVTNPLAFEGGEDKAEPMDTVGSTEPPPAPGSKGATKEAWQNYANHYGVSFTQEMSVKEIAEACEAAGIAV